MMSIENRLNNLEKLILPQEGDKWIAFVSIICTNGDPGILVVSRRNRSIQFDNKKEFLNYAKDNGIEAEEIKRLCLKLNWN